MNLEDLRSAQTRERATDGLQELRDSFYGDVAEYIEELKDQREAAAAAADDPFGDPEVQELTDKIETAEQVAEAIYERRMGKLVKQASLAAAGMPDDVNGLTTEERELYGDLVERIEANKSHVLDVISGEAAQASEDAGRDEEPTTERTGGAQRGDGLDESPATPEAGDAPPGSGEDSGDASAAAAMGGGLDADESGSSDDGDASGDEGRDAPAAGSNGANASDDAAADAGADAGAGGDARNPGPDAAPADAEPPEVVANDLAAVREEAAGDADGSSRAESAANARDSGGDGDDVDRTTVRVTDDVGEIFGMDEREYTLEAEDVVTLPAENAEPLVEKGAAEKLD